MAKKQAKEKVTIEHLSRNVLGVGFPYVHVGWEQWILLASDRHHDSKWTDRELEIKHLEMAKERNAYVIDVGDVFDVMQGKYDPRRSYKDLRPEYTVENYLDEIVADAANFYNPYADRFLVISRGNHEQSVLKNNGVDLISNLTHRLNEKNKLNIQAGYYGGWVKFKFNICETQRVSKNLKYFHGSGGGGPVTRGVIQTNRQAVFLPDADIVVNGHTHDAWHVPIQRERLGDRGAVYQDIQHHVRTATYKDEYRDGGDGWHIETGKPPKPIGACWMRLYCETMERDGKNRPDIGMEFTQALRQ
jgi:hypothetical protein